MNSVIELYRPALKRKDFSAVLHCLVHDLSVPEQPRRKFMQNLCELTKMRSGWAYRDMERAINHAFSLADITAGSRVGLSPFISPLYVDLLFARKAVPMLLDLGQKPVISSVPEGLAAVIIDGSFGFCADIPSIRQTCPVLIEDASYTLGSSREGVADIMVLSHEADALLTTGGGGSVLTTAKVSHTVPDWQAMLDINASLGLTQLNQLRRQCIRRQEIFQLFVDVCGDTHFTPLQERSVHWGFLLSLTTNREEFFHLARRMKVMVRPAFPHPLWEDDRLNSRELPHARSLARDLVEIPLYPHLRHAELQRIQSFLKALW